MSNTVLSLEHDHGPSDRPAYTVTSVPMDAVFRRFADAVADPKNMKRLLSRLGEAGVKELGEVMLKVNGYTTAATLGD